MAREIERKFLVSSEAWRAEADAGTAYRQGYLAMTPQCTVRVRIAGSKAYVTIKGPRQGIGRDEFEYAIPIDDAKQMLNLAVQPLIEKTRYIVKQGGHKWEIDEFAGLNAGLIVAEVELDNEDVEVHRPDWLGEEVTQDRRYYNASLVRHPFIEWNAPGRS